ncbi:hypothetical protein L7F22_007369 [Adiantum nelumboides]|nr:hypothetical protein [Adiantum nelumboides]
MKRRSHTIFIAALVCQNSAHCLRHYLEKLAKKARKADGELIVTNGNHEIMNIEGDFMYATFGACFEFQNWAHWVHQGNVIKELRDGVKRSSVYEDVLADEPLHLWARHVALRLGGPIASRFLGHDPIVLMVRGTVFVHGGILPSHATYGLERVVWQYLELKEQQCDCQLLEKVLHAIPGSTRMIVGHTIQQPFGTNGSLHESSDQGGGRDVCWI